MEESTFHLLTSLCSDFVEDAICGNPSTKKNIIKKLRSQAYKILLNNRDQHIEDDLENTPTLLLANVHERVYCKAKAKSQWTEDVVGEINNLIDRAETLAESNSSFVPVLKFLLCLAENTSTSGLEQQEPSSVMKILITDHDFKHKPLIKSVSSFNSKIFEMPTPVRVENDPSLSVGLFNLIPGTGLKHQQFFLPLISSTSVESRKFEEDVNNGNWIHSKLTAMNIPVISTTSDPRGGMHPDEGYVTPDQDLTQNQEIPYIPWEDICDENLNFTYSWESFGSALGTKEPKFVCQERDSVQQISRFIHASDVTSFPGAKPVLTALTNVSIEELEVAFKNLLVGVESTIFHYDKGRSSFVLKNGLCLKDTIANIFEEYCKDFIECGNRFKQLNEVTGVSGNYGLVFQMLCNTIRQYLQCYRGVVLKMPPMQSLLTARDWLYKLSSQMQFLISLCPNNSETKSKDLLIYLCDKMPVTYRHDLALIYSYILQSCFTVYFTFLSKWIFEGVTDVMWEEEFFITCNPLTADMYNRKFWSEGFVLDQELVPNCLKGLEDKLLLCGKSIALLKLCASEDPICKQVKREHPEILCSFYEADLVTVEKRFESYKENYKAICQELFGTTVPETHNAEYYANRMTKTLNEIKDRQEEERRLKAEKKQIEFNVLKKEMEDAKARKIEEKRNLLKEEEKLLEEAEKLDQLNDLRRQEEREKIMHLYSTLSEAADRRRDRAEWKMRRAELHDRRCAFWKNEREWLKEQLEHNKEETDSQQVEGSKLLLAERSLEKYLETYSVIPGSGDHVRSEGGSEPPLQETSKSSVLDFANEPSKQLFHGGADENLDAKHGSEDQGTINDAKRDWMIALDVADQARQSALLFKQRNMHNDYNIITGEETTYESKFGEKHIQETNDECFSSHTISSKDTSSNDNEDCENRDTAYPDENVSISSIAHNEKNEDEVLSVSGLHSSGKPLCSPMNASKKSEISLDEPEISNILNTSFVPTQANNKPEIQEIDMISIHQSVHKSVMIPLLTQLELTGDAILRLFNRHNLFQHIECIWKYFFLLEGEFARNVTKNLFEEAQKGQHPSSLLNVIKLNSLLRCAVGPNVDEEFTERLSFYVKEIPSVFRPLDPDMLECLSLRYKTHWPINIIITDEIIAKQDVIFKHLLKLHRMSWALEETIYLLKDKRLFNSEEYRQVQLFRHVMTHFITTVRQYITAVVVEKTWCEFRNKLEGAETVDNIYDLYQTYVRNVNSKCLLGKARAHTEQFFNSIFKEVLTFYEALRSGEWIQDAGATSYRHSNFTRITHAFDNFKKMAEHLVYLFIKMSNTYPNIVQLATTLSLNNFYIVKEKHCL